MIDLEATGKNIRRLRTEKGVTVRFMQHKLGFATVNAIYKWEKGMCLPTIDNLVILADDIFGCKIDDIIIRKEVV